MKSRLAQITTLLLDKYSDLLYTQNEVSFDESFINLFLKSELIEILATAVDIELIKSLDVNRLSKMEIYQLIGPSHYIVSFVKTQLLDYSLNSLVVTDKNLKEVLEQLQLPLHYLFSKPTSYLNNYDKSNIKNLFNKAGRLKRFWGIFSKIQTDEQLGAYYDSYSEAQQELAYRVELGICSKDSCVILQKQTTLIFLDDDSL